MLPPWTLRPLRALVLGTLWLKHLTSLQLCCLTWYLKLALDIRNLALDWIRNLAMNWIRNLALNWIRNLTLDWDLRLNLSFPLN